jgi:hypothetical protein
MGQDQGSETGVMAPEEKGVAVCQIRSREIHAERVAEACVLVPVANMRGGGPVWASKGIEKSAEPALGVVD